jgi:hypothetical protein
MIHRLLPLLFLLAPFAISADQFTESELKSLFYADLGPTTIDVSHYPKKQQENYALFSQVCARCHTLARAVNSPSTGRQAWDFYIFIMRLGSIMDKKDRFTMEQGRNIRDFLVYDGKERKLKDRKRFEELTGDLQLRFARTIEERMRRLQETNPPRTNP